LGDALMHLMDAIDTQVQPTTPERKGDWKPLVYLMTDGKPTDDCRKAVALWKQQYAKRAQLIAVGLGKHAATGVLSQFSDHVLSYNGEDSADFYRFIEWMTMSVRSQSIRVQQHGKEDLPISLEKAENVLAPAEDHPGSDEDFAIFVGRCQQRQTPYLLKYERILLASSVFPEGRSEMPATGESQYCYRMTGCYPIDETYFDWSIAVNQVESQVDFQGLIGQASCPHCGNVSALGLCACGRLFCVDGTSTTASCPWCKQQLTMVPMETNERFDIVRSLG
jgi:hypothetical protein